MAAAAALLTVVATATATGTRNESSAEASTTLSGSPSPTTRPSVGGSGGLLGLGLPALYRALFVLAALAGLGLLYYVGGRVIRVRKPPRKKYGLLSNSDDHMEMASFESDEDTVFETRNLRR